MKNLLFIFMFLPLIVMGADADYTPAIKDHCFQPAELAVQGVIIAQ